MKRTLIGAAALIALVGTGQVAMAQSGGGFFSNVLGILSGDRDTRDMKAVIWVDPDGCEHWVMDDGWEGYMTPHVNRQGIPVCHGGGTCAVMNSDQLFMTNSHRISKTGKAMLANFFQSAGATSYIIAGHTDSRASDEYNMRLVAMVNAFHVLPTALVRAWR